MGHDSRREHMAYNRLGGWHVRLGWEKIGDSDARAAWKRGTGLGYGSNVKDDSSIGDWHEQRWWFEEASLGRLMACNDRCLHGEVAAKRRRNDRREIDEHSSTANEDLQMEETQNGGECNCSTTT
uniref:Uncharacterized protein n=1 Tax=Cucumis melo TaxID=3656 RepID=A0A9I9CYQ4_CUCME